MSSKLFDDYFDGNAQLKNSTEASQTAASKEEGQLRKVEQNNATLPGDSSITYDQLLQENQTLKEDNKKLVDENRQLKSKLEAIHDLEQGKFDFIWPIIYAISIRSMVKFLRIEVINSLNIFDKKLNIHEFKYSNEKDQKEYFCFTMFNKEYDKRLIEIKDRIKKKLIQDKYIIKLFNWNSYDLNEKIHEKELKIMDEIELDILLKAINLRKSNIDLIRFYIKYTTGEWVNIYDARIQNDRFVKNIPVKNVTTINNHYEAKSNNFSQQLSAFGKRNNHDFSESSAYQTRVRKIGQTGTGTGSGTATRIGTGAHFN